MSNTQKQLFFSVPHTKYGFQLRPRTPVDPKEQQRSPCDWIDGCPTMLNYVGDGDGEVKCNQCVFHGLPIITRDEMEKLVNTKSLGGMLL